MAKNTKQIALIQHRTGNQSELTDLHEAEFGLAVDTNNVFIGNPNNPKLNERIQSNTFPYGNIQLLTEFSDNLEMIKYIYSTDGSQSKLPIIITGTKLYPLFPAGTSIIINGQTITFEKDTDAQGFCDKINSIEDLGVKAQIVEGGRIQLISNGETIIIENGESPSGTGALEIIGITTDDSYTENAAIPNERTIQEVLDDYCSVKNFGVLGDGTTDDADSFYNAILTVFCNDNPASWKGMLVPAGEYIINKKPLVLATNTHLKGDGIDRTIIKCNDYTNGMGMLITTMDSNYALADLTTTNTYGVNAEIAHNVLVEDMTFDISESTMDTVLLLGSVNDVWFKNVKFKGYSDVINGNGSILANIQKTPGLQDSSHIYFINCEFENAKQAVSITNNLHWFAFYNCQFKDITGTTVNITSYNTDGVTSNGLFVGSMFSNCSKGGTIVSLTDRTQYVTFTKTLFDKEVTETNTVATRFNNLSTKNNIDTLDPEDNELKLYGFNFYQPEWRFVDYLATPNGDKLVQGAYDTTIIDNEEVVQPLTNGLIIHQGDETNDNKVSLSSTNPLGDFGLGAGYYGNLDLGGSEGAYSNWEMGVNYTVGNRVQVAVDNGYVIYECLQNHMSSGDITIDDPTYWRNIGLFTPATILSKPLDLNANPIRNDAGNITFQTTANNYLVIDDSNHTGDLSYAERIATDADAVPNVDYVNRLASTENRYGVDYAAIQTVVKARIPLIFFDKDIYGDFINLKQLSVNMRRPFYSVRDKINENCLSWQSGLSYSAGDIVSHEETYDGEIGTYYYMCSQNHISSASFDDDAGRTGRMPMWYDVYLQGNDYDTGLLIDLPDIKYLGIVASNNEDAARLLLDRDTIDVTRRDIHSEYYANWAASTAYNVGDTVQYLDRYYICQSAHTSADAHELFNPTYWSVKQETGFNYIFNFERNLQKLDPTTFEVLEDEADFTLEYNYSDYTIYLELLDENLNLLPIFLPINGNFVTEDEKYNSRTIQCSAAGVILVTIDYLRGQNNIIVADED